MFPDEVEVNPDMRHLPHKPQPVSAPVRLQRISIDNFKSLVGFDMDLAKFTCLVGLNGAGKSTILQALDFLSQQVKGDLSGWLKNREWAAIDLKSKLSKSSNVSFEVVFDLSGRHALWRGSFNRTLLRCTQETLEIADSTLLKVDDGRYLVSELVNEGESRFLAQGEITFEYQGSLLSQLKESVLNEDLRVFKHFVAGITSLDALSPQHLRRRSRESDGSLGFAGEKLSAFLHQLPESAQQRLFELLQGRYPQLHGLELSALRAGWKALGIVEEYAGLRFSTEARHINDGMLRLMAILAETLSAHEFMLFDEIENGINPELIEFLLDYLVGAPQQIMVTTHSPMILNYLDDDVARRGVQLIYKTPEGKTRAIPFFSIPSVAEKLTVLGPGEVFVDTDLVRLPEEIARLAGGRG